MTAGNLPSYLRQPAYQYKLEKIKRRNENLVYSNPADFINAQMFIPETGAPLQLHPRQYDVLQAMAARDDDGNFIYSTWLYSAPKKSAKTTIGAGVALWQAWRVPDGEIYIIGNDLKQADNRMAQAIRYCVEHNPYMRARVKVTSSKYKIQLDNGTRIESIPVDPRGEAGMNPTGLFWTETWGAYGNAAEMLWSEATLSPTRSGQSFKFVESYAGYTGQSTILERLYKYVVKKGVLTDVPELYTNGATIGYWCTERYLSWQQDAAYYTQQAAEKTPAEFDRQHENRWVDSLQLFVPAAWWTACRGDVPALERGESLIIGLDAAVSGDCFAIVAVSRRGELVYPRYVNVWYPPPGGKIDYGAEGGPESEVRRLCRELPVAQVCYDPYQLHDMATRLTNEGVAWFEEFPQGQDRLMADKQLYDNIRDRNIIHAGETALAEHIGNAAAEIDKADAKLRIVKRDAALKIDAAVALSMASYRARYLLIG